MATISVSVPDDLRTKMLAHEEMNWSAIARKAFEERVSQIEFLKKLAAKSKITEKDAAELAANINKGVAKRFMEM